MVRVVMALSLPLVLVGGAIAAEKATESTHTSPGALCADMMRQPSPDGQKAMHDFMQSERAPHAMANMMDMARRMGDGDALVGMRRMMEMMGGQGGMMQPGGAHPGK
jgi:hypothetical protein